MFATERKREILRILTEQGKVKTLELAEMLDVSEPTIRRDIADLDSHGLLIRTHGGALPVEEHRQEASFVEKVDRFAREKAQIGQVAADLIKDGDTVLLDAGTTTLQIARHLTASNLTVLTNSLDIAHELENKENVELVLTGGNIRWNTRALVGPVTESTLRMFRVDKAFIGTNAVTIGDGVTTPNLVEAQTKKTMIDIARQAFAVADHTKFDHVDFCQVAPLSKLAGIISDSNLDEAILNQYEQADIQVIIKGR